MQGLLKIFTCTDHHYIQPTGVASVVFAVDRSRAKMLLDRELRARGLKPWGEHKYTLVEVSNDKPLAVILQDGDY